jgi:methylated-DNA-[protein]-cysteine S-methyltransferase
LYLIQPFILFLANLMPIFFSDILIHMPFTEIKITQPCWLKTIPSTPIGSVTLTGSIQGLLQVDFAEAGGSQAFSEPLPASPAPAYLDLAAEEVEAYLNGTLKTIHFPIDWIQFSPFEQLVLQAAVQITYGEVITYGELARRIGRSCAARAVGGALGRNPMPLVIPCHRVIGADRRLHGYSAPGGLDTKARLLQLEGCRIVDQRVA